jgi:hypothetical protein
MPNFLKKRLRRAVEQKRSAYAAGRTASGHSPSSDGSSLAEVPTSIYERATVPPQYMTFRIKKVGEETCS